MVRDILPKCSVMVGSRKQTLCWRPARYQAVPNDNSWKHESICSTHAKEWIAEGRPALMKFKIVNITTGEELR